MIEIPVERFFLVKNKTPEEREKRRGGIQKTELGELKERLAKTEAALTKLMEATNMISEKMNPDGKSKKTIPNPNRGYLKLTISDLQKLFGDQKIIEELLKKEEKRIEDEEKENKPTEEKSAELKPESDDPVENKDEVPLETNAEKVEESPSEETEESSEPIEENITTKSVEDDSSVRQRKPKSEEESKEDIPVVETIGQTERQTKTDVNDTEQTVDLENKKTD